MKPLVVNCIIFKKKSNVEVVSLSLTMHVGVRYFDIRRRRRKWRRCGMGEGINGRADGTQRLITLSYIFFWYVVRVMV